MSEFVYNDFEEVAEDYSGKSMDELYEELMVDTKRSKDEFVYYYGKYYEAMTSLTGGAKDLLTWLTFNCEVNSGRVLVQSITLRNALKELGVTTGTFYKSLAILKEKEIVKGSNAVYYVNPAYAWKGTADVRAKFLKVFPLL